MRFAILPAINKLWLMNGNDTKLSGLTGKWNWRETAAPFENRWEIMRRFTSNEHFWIFRDDGCMVSYADGKLCYVVSWSFAPEKKILVLDGYEVDGQMQRKYIIYERYRVEFHDDLLYLYDEEEFIDGAGCRLRLCFSRIKE